MKIKYEIESIIGGEKQTEEAYAYDEATMAAEYAIESGADLVTIKEYRLDGYGNKKDLIVKYTYDHGKELLGESIVPPEMSNAEIEEWIENINEECWGADLPITILDGNEKQELIELIKEYKRVRGTSGVKSIVLSMSELLNGEQIKSEIGETDDVEIKLEPLEENKKNILEEMEKTVREPNEDHQVEGKVVSTANQPLSNALKDLAKTKKEKEARLEVPELKDAKMNNKNVKLDKNKNLKESKNDAKEIILDEIINHFKTSPENKLFKDGLYIEGWMFKDEEFIYGMKELGYKYTQDEDTFDGLEWYNKSDGTQLQVSNSGSSKDFLEVVRVGKPNKKLKEEFEESYGSDYFDEGDTFLEGGNEYRITGILATTQNRNESELCLVKAENIEDSTEAYYIMLDGEYEWGPEETEERAREWYYHADSDPDADEFDDDEEFSGDIDGDDDGDPYMNVHSFGPDFDADNEEEDFDFSHVKCSNCGAVGDFDNNGHCRSCEWDDGYEETPEDYYGDDDDLEEDWDGYDSGGRPSKFNSIEYDSLDFEDIKSSSTIELNKTDGGYEASWDDFDDYTWYPTKLDAIEAAVEWLKDIYKQVIFKDKKYKKYNFTLNDLDEDWIMEDESLTESYSRKELRVKINELMRNQSITKEQFDRFWDDLDEDDITPLSLEIEEIESQITQETNRKREDEEYKANTKIEIQAEIDREYEEEILPILNKANTLGEELFDIVVPPEGNSDTLGGEIVRAANRIMYRWKNDGDKFFIGYGIETCGPAILFLIDKLPEIRKWFINVAEHISGYGNSEDSDKKYDAYIEQLNNLILRMLKNKPEVFKQYNEEDMFDYTDEDRIKEIFEEFMYEDYDLEELASNALWAAEVGHATDYEEIMEEVKSGIEMMFEGETSLEAKKDQYSNCWRALIGNTEDIERWCVDVVKDTFAENGWDPKDDTTWPGYEDDSEDESDNDEDDDEN